MSSCSNKLNDVTVLSAKVEAKDNNQLRQMMDDLKQKLDKAVIVLGAVDGDKVMISAGVTKDCWWKLPCRKYRKTSSRAMWR